MLWIPYEERIQEFTEFHYSQFVSQLARFDLIFSLGYNQIVKQDIIKKPHIVENYEAWFEEIGKNRVNYYRHFNNKNVKDLRSYKKALETIRGIEKEIFLIAYENKLTREIINKETYMKNFVDWIDVHIRNVNTKEFIEHLENDLQEMGGIHESFLLNK